MTNQDSHVPILITGGTGFAGSHLVEALQERDMDNIHVTQISQSEGYVHGLLPESHIHQLDLTDREATFELVHKLQPQHIYHLAAYAAVGSSFEKTYEVLENNLQLQLNILEAVKAHSPQARILIIGSAMEYDLVTNNPAASEPIDELFPLGPTSPYAVSKVLQDLLGYAYARSYDLDIIRVRPFNHIGERQSPEFAVSAFAKQIVAIERGEQPELSVGNLETVRDFTDVKDMALAYILLMEKGQKGEVYNIGSGHGYKMREIVHMLIQLATTDIKIVEDQKKFRPADVPTAIANASKLRELGWEPTHAINETVSRIIDFWREQ